MREYKFFLSYFQLDVQSMCWTQLQRKENSKGWSDDEGWLVRKMASITQDPSCQIRPRGYKLPQGQ